MKTKKTIEQHYLEKVQKGQLPLFYKSPVFVDDLEFLDKINYISITKYQTDFFPKSETKISRPICKCFKL